MRFILLSALSLLTLSVSARAETPVPGTVFQDCPYCPEMVVLPRGTFQMGSTEHDREKPVHPVTIAYPLAIGRFKVTFGEWDACAADGGCLGDPPSDNGWGRGNRPVMNVSWNDAQRYVAWLARKTGKPYRLQSEAEYEYAGRAGSTSRFWWGSEPDKNMAACDGCGSAWDNVRTAPEGIFPANGFGVFDTAGNLSEWVQDRWNPSFEGAPGDGSAWETGDQRRRVFRGGSWFNYPRMITASYRNGDAPTVANFKIGFRVALTLSGN